jgi:hypothetical protein
MKSANVSVFDRLFRPLATALAFALLTGTVCLAQSSVEKSETSQQAREPVNELERARIIVTKPNEPKPAPPETGRMWGTYLTTSSMEVGYRFIDDKGNTDRFRSEANLRDGFRLLEYSMEMRSAPGTGILFDTLRTEVNNAGGDQSQTFTMRADKARAYRFDGSVRRFTYFRRPGPTFVNNWRDHDLRQQISDFNLKLFPQRAVRVNLGYGRTMAKGRFTPTYGFERDNFQVLGQTRWEANDYRVGIEASWRGWGFNLEGLYRGFKDDPANFSRPGVDQGLLVVNNTAALSFLDRDIPLRGRSGVIRGSIRGSFAERVHLVVRALHDDEKMRARYIENTAGNAFTGPTVKINSRNFTATGFVERPGNVVDAAATIDLNQHFSIGNTFRYNSFRIQGDVETLQTTIQQTGTANPVTLLARTLGLNRLTELRSLWNTLELNMNYGRKFMANLGWRAMQRDVTLGGIFQTPTSVPSANNPRITDDEESITTHAFVGGMRVRPTNRTSFIFDVEHGQNNNAFVRITPLDFTRFRFRTQIQATNTLTLIGAVTTTDRTNPTPQVENDVNVRSYTMAVNWEPNSRVWIDAGYDYHDIFSTGRIAFFRPATPPATGNVLVTGTLFNYGRMNNVFVNTRFGLTRRLDLLTVYYFILDRGAPGITLGPNDAITTLPLRRHNPEVRVAYRFTNNVTGNLSYRHFSYNEKQFFTQDYRANALTASMRFTF